MEPGKGEDPLVWARVGSGGWGRRPILFPAVNTAPLCGRHRPTSPGRAGSEPQGPGPTQLFVQPLHIVGRHSKTQWGLLL